MRKNEASAILKAIANWIDMATAEEIQAITEGKARFVLAPAPDEDAARENPGRLKLDLDRVQNRLETAESIEQGLEILREEGFDRRRQDLARLAKTYQVGVRKSEPMVDLAQRIVSAVVGSRLQAETMRTLDLDRKSRTVK